MKKAIVIGATSGIGRGIADILTKQGYKVAITGRRSQLLEDIRKENPEKYIPYAFDVRETDKTSFVLDHLAHSLGGLDLLIYSSGTGERINDPDYTRDKIVIETNISGFTAVADWSFNYFNRQGYGHFVNISSIAGLRGNRYAPSYAASKAYQINYLEGFRQKARKMNVPLSFTDVRPGFVDTAMAKGDDIFWVSTVEKASRQIFQAIKKKKKVVYITRRWILFALLMKLMPSFVYERI